MWCLERAVSPPRQIRTRPLQAISLRGISLEDHRVGGLMFPSKVDGVQVADGAFVKSAAGELEDFWYS